MVAALIGLLGVGGIVTALVFIPGLLPAVLAFLSRLTMKQIACIAIVALVAGLVWYVAHLRAEQDTLQASLTNLTDASKRASDAATRIKVATETRNITIKDNADAALDTARVDSDRRLADFIRLHRPTAASSAGKADLSKPAASPEVDNGTGGSAVVDAADLAICTRNTDRLNNAHDWSVAVSTPIEGAN